MAASSPGVAPCLSAVRVGLWDCCRREDEIRALPPNHPPRSLFSRSQRHLGTRQVQWCLSFPPLGAKVGKCFKSNSPDNDFHTVFYKHWQVVNTSSGLLEDASLVNPTMSLKNIVTSSNSIAWTEVLIFNCSVTNLRNKPQLQYTSYCLKCAMSSTLIACSRRSDSGGATRKDARCAKSGE